MTKKRALNLISHRAEGKAPMEKNVTVFDSEGKIIGTTWPRRAAGLVKNGRARYYGGVETAIILARSPDIESSKEDENMSNITNEELRAKIEEMVREAREKLDAVCKTAADAIDDLVENIEERENDVEDVEDADGAGGASDAEGADDASEADADVDIDDTDADGEPRQRGHLIRISDEDMEKLRAKMKSLRDSMMSAADEAKNVAVKAGAEIGRYAESVKAKVTEKIAEAKAKEAETGSKCGPEPGTEAYYLAKIEEVHRDGDFIKEALANIQNIKSWGPGDVGAQETAAAIGTTVQARAAMNHKMLDFYMEQLRDVRRRNNEAARLALEDARRNAESPEERRARMIREDPMIERIMALAAEANKDDPSAIHAATEYLQEYIRQTYGDNPDY